MNRTGPQTYPAPPSREPARRPAPRVRSSQVIYFGLFFFISAASLSLSLAVQGGTTPFVRA